MRIWLPYEHMAQTVCATKKFMWAIGFFVCTYCWSKSIWAFIREFPINFEYPKIEGNLFIKIDWNHWAHISHYSTILRLMAVKVDCKAVNVFIIFIYSTNEYQFIDKTFAGRDREQNSKTFKVLEAKKSICILSIT